MSEEWPDYMTDADQLDERFLAEVERRAGASREQMLEDVKRVVIGQPSHRVVRVADRLRRILGEKP